MPDQNLSGVHILLVLMKAYRAVGGYLAPTLRASGLGDSDFRVLEILLHKGPLPVNAIGPKVFLTPGSISTAVDRLHRKRLVSRTNCDTDRRVHTVALSPKGRNVITRVFAAHARRMEDLASVLTPTERLHLMQALKKLGKRAAAALDTPA